MPLPPAATLLRWWGRQRWLAFGLRDRVLRLAADPDAMAPTPFICDFHGLRYRGDLASFIDWSIFFYGAYEGAVLAFLRDTARRIGPRTVFLDIGANVGQHSLFMSRHAACVHAFEPWAEARLRMEENLALNRIANVTIHPFGLGDASGEATFFAPASANLGTGSFVAEVNHNQALGRLPVMRGDEAVARLGITQVDLIKIDTEGYEVKILAGLAATLARHRPLVVCELSETTLADLGADALAGLGELFGKDWQFLSLGHHPETYRLRPYEGHGGTLTLVAAPSERLGLLPRRGG